MTNSDAANKLRSFALPPTEEEQAAWEALSRDEQVRLIREHFASEAVDTISHRSQDEILAMARERLLKKAHG